jgi:probable blue pigment (indigoidine) exporter
MRDLGIVGVSAVAPALWGTTYLVTTELLPEHRPLLAGTLRALPAGLLLIGVVAVLTGRRSPGRPRLSASILPSGAWWWRAPLLGTLNIGVFFALLFVAAYRLPGGVAAVVGAVGPFVVAGIAFLLLRERPVQSPHSATDQSFQSPHSATDQSFQSPHSATDQSFQSPHSATDQHFQRRTLVAAAVGVVGVALLVLKSSVTLDPVGLLAAAGGVLTMSLGTVLGRRWGVPAGYSGRATALLALTGWQLTSGGLLLAVVALAVEGPPPALTAVNLAGFGYLSILGTAFAYVLWFRGVTTLAPARVTLLALLSPTVAAMIGWAVLGQALSAGQLVGAAAVLGAVVLGTSTPGGSIVTRFRLRAGRFGDRDAAPCPAPGRV